MNAKTIDGKTALSSALLLCRSETDLDCIYQLINSGADLNARVSVISWNQKDLTPLMLAIKFLFQDITEQQQYDLFRYMLEQGADYTLTEGQGLTVLELATQQAAYGNYASFYQRIEGLVRAFIDKKTLLELTTNNADSSDMPLGL